MLWLEGHGTGAQAWRVTPVFHPYQLTLMQDTCTCNDEKYFDCLYSPFPGLSSAPGFSPYPRCSSQRRTHIILPAVLPPGELCLFVGPSAALRCSATILQCLFSLVCCPGLPGSPGAVAGRSQCSGCLFLGILQTPVQRMSLSSFSEI